MIAPGARHGPISPHPLSPLFLVLLGVLVLGAGWVILLTQGAATGSLSGNAASAPAAEIRSVAYILPEGPEDVVYIRSMQPGAQPVPLTAFPRALNFEARGLASPQGDRLAILHLADLPGLPARLTLVSLHNGSQQAIAGGFDYLSGIAWSPSGAKVTAVRTSLDGAGGKQRIAVLEVDTITGNATQAAMFEGAHQAVPVGYSPDGQKLYIAVIDQSGSSLWASTEGRAERVASLSAGPTRDWSLSPDGAHLAFIDRLGVGERRYAARILTIATKTVEDAKGAGDQIGAAWRPDSRLVDFGGPDGSVRLTHPQAGEDYVIPLRWSPDGAMMAATVYGLSGVGTGDPVEHVEIATEEWRVRLSDKPGARFLGFVRDR